MSDIAEAIKTETREKLKTAEPDKYDVLFLNDEVTTVDFVIRILKQIFGKTQEEAIKICEYIHNNGQGIVGTYLYEIAEQKGIETTMVAREEGFPLQVKVQKHK
jgi:ATP-dependent Clp protease adaptor protein ClpS